MQRLTAIGTTIALTLVLTFLPGCGRDPWWTDPNATWITAYGGENSDVGEGLLLAADGGCFIVGTSNLRFGPEPQGDVYLVRTDAMRAVLWERTYDRGGLQSGESIVATSDGGLAIAGWSSSPDTDGADAYLLKLASDGEPLWSATLEGPLDERAKVLFETADGGYLLVGNSVDPADTVADSGAAGYGGYDARASVYLARTDAHGNELWSQVHDSGLNVLVASAVPMLDGGALILATIMYFPEPDDDLYLLRVDEHGNKVWTRTWEDDRRAGFDLVATADGNFLIAGSIGPSDDEDRSTADFLFVKVDPGGSALWTKTLGHPSMIDYADAVAVTLDGGFVAAGNRRKSYFGRSEDLVLVKINAEGELVWERLLETATHNMFGGVLQRPDGGYLIAGSTIMENEAFDVFLVKTDHEGKVEE